MSSAPTLVLIPGAWHSPAIFAPLYGHLAPHPIAPTASLPSVGPASPLALCKSADSDYIRSLIETLLVENKDVVVVAHSYGAVPAATACAGLAEGVDGGRAAGEKKGGRVLGLVVLSGFLVPEGMSLKEASGGREPTWYREDSVAGVCPIPPFSAFASSIQSTSHTFAESTLSVSSSHIFHAVNGRPCWAEPAFKDRVAFVRCAPNNVLPPQGADSMVKRAESLGAQFVHREIGGFGHFPWLWESGVEKVSEVVKELITVFEKAAEEAG